MKTCKTCGLAKPYNAAAGQSKKTSGFKGAVCWDCYLVAKALFATTLRTTPEGRTKLNAANAKATAKIRATLEGRIKARAACLAWQKKYPAKNVANGAKYKTSKLQRIPPWANLEAIKQVYAEAQQKGLEVDHIYPLQGTLVSGLHVENNLQLLTQAANRSKGNRMPKEA